MEMMGIRKQAKKKMLEKIIVPAWLLISTSLSLRFLNYKMGVKYLVNNNHQYLKSTYEAALNRCLFLVSQQHHYDVGHPILQMKKLRLRSYITCPRLHS